MPSESETSQMSYWWDFLETVASPVMHALGFVLSDENLIWLNCFEARLSLYIVPFEIVKYNISFIWVRWSRYFNDTEKNDWLDENELSVILYSIRPFGFLYRSTATRSVLSTTKLQRSPKAAAFSWGKSILKSLPITILVQS